MNRTLYTTIFLFSAFVCPAKEGVKIPDTKPVLSFIENAGQVQDQHRQHRNDIDVKLDAGNGLSIFIGKGEVHYQWGRPLQTSPQGGGFTKDVSDLPLPLGAEGGLGNHHLPLGEDGRGVLSTYRMDVMLLGANTNAQLLKQNEQEYFERYYTEWSGEDGAVAHSYGKIIYKDVYPHIDWVLYTHNGGLKYDFIVHPGGRVADIQLRYEGATSLAVENGALVAKNPMGSITEAAPYSYEAGSDRAVSSNYVLDGNTLRFNTGGYKSTLVIDPGLKWGTYYGGSGDDKVAAVKAIPMPTGGAYICGYSLSTGNIASTGAFQDTLTPPTSYYDAFVARLNVNGGRVWGTYYGGNKSDYLNSLGLDAAGNLYAGGITESSGLGTSGTFQPGFTTASGQSGLLVKFNTSGQRLWASYYGNSGSEILADIAVDGAGYIYTAIQAPASAMATAGSLMPTQVNPNPPYNIRRGLIAKMNPSGSRVWASYYPGTPTAVAIDGAGNLYIGGRTIQVAEIVTPGCHQPVYNGPSTTVESDGFLARLDTSGAIRYWSTYYGSTSYDAIEQLVCDVTGNLYGLGTTLGNNNVATAGSYMSTHPLVGAGISFFVKFSNTGIRQWGSYYPVRPSAGGIDIDSTGRSYIYGSTDLSGYATAGAYKTTITGAKDALLGIFNSNGTLLHATYYGGPSNEVGDIGSIASWNNLSCSNDGAIYIAGITASTTGIATSGVHQTVNNSGGIWDGFVARFDGDTAVYITDPLQQNIICTGGNPALQYKVTQQFRAGNTFTAQLSNASGSFASPTNIGSVTSSVAGTIPITIPGSAPSGAGYRIRIVATLPADTTLDNGVDIGIYPQPAKPVASANTPICTGQTLNLTGSGTGGVFSWAGPNSYTANTQNAALTGATLAANGDYIVTIDNNGCKAKDTVSVVVDQMPVTPVATNNGPLCAGAILTLGATSTAGSSYTWTGPGNFSSTQQNPAINPVMAANAGTYSVTANINGCTSGAATTTVVVNSVILGGAYASPNDTTCPGGTVTFVASIQNAGPVPTYQWYKNGGIIAGATNKVYVTNTLLDGDSVYCRVAATGVCATVLNIYTNGIKMRMLPGYTYTPQVIINAVPALPIPNQPVVFNAASPNGGPTPQLQWRRHGVDVPGAVNATFSVSDLIRGEEVSCTITTNDICASPNTGISNIIMADFPVGISNISKGGIHIYPNPLTDKLIIEGTAAGTVITLYDITGRQLQSTTATGNKTELNTANLPAGSYLLEIITSPGGGRVGPQMATRKQ